MQQQDEHGGKATAVWLDRAALEAEAARAAEHGVNFIIHEIPNNIVWLKFVTDLRDKGAEEIGFVHGEDRIRFFTVAEVLFLASMHS